MKQVEEHAGIHEQWASISARYLWAVSSNCLTVTAVTFDPHTEATSYQISLPSEQIGEDREGEEEKEGGNEESKRYHLFHLILTTTFMSKQKIQSIDYEMEVTKEK